MADAEDDDIGEPAPKRVHYGSLEEVERQRLLERSGNNAGSMSAEIKAGIEAGHINVSACKPLHCQRLHVAFSSYNRYLCTCTHPRPPWVLPIHCSRVYGEDVLCQCS